MEDILNLHALPCFSMVRSKKTNKKQFKTVEKERYLRPDQIFEAFVGTVDDLAPPIYLKLEDVDRQMLYDNTCPLAFVTILLNHSVQCCYNAETSLSIYTVNYCTGFYIITTLG